MYAHILENADQAKLDAHLDEPLLAELTPEQRQRAEMRRVADANRAAVQALGMTAGMHRP